MNGAGLVQTIALTMRRMFWPFCYVAMVAGTILAGANEVSADGALVASRNYEIPAQALDAALNVYIRASGAQVLYETSLTNGRRSMDVKGHFTPDEALNALLSGTGLLAHRTDIDAFVITSAPAGQTSASRPITRPDGHFMAALQSGVLDALCRNAKTRPGGYKVAMELWIASTGVVQRSALVGSTGDTDRDGAILAALKGISIRRAPPADLPQPLILRIDQRVPKETGDCDG